MKGTLVAVTAAVVILSGCGTAPSDPVPTPTETPTPTPAIFTVEVEMQIAQYMKPDTAECWGSGGYADIGPGTQVKISDASGKILSLGKLGPGKPHDNFPEVGGFDACRFTATVAGVPISEGVYGVEVASRGVVNFQRDGDPTKVAVRLG